MQVCACVLPPPQETKGTNNELSAHGIDFYKEDNYCDMWILWRIAYLRLKGRLSNQVKIQCGAQAWCPAFNCSRCRGSWSLILRLQFQDNWENIEPVSNIDCSRARGRPTVQEVLEFITRKVCAISSSSLPHACAHQTWQTCLLGTLLHFLGGG